MDKYYKNILVPVDGSEQSYKAVDEAVRIARLNQAKLHVLTVKDLNKYYGAVHKGILETPGLDQLAKDILANCADIIREQVEYETYEVAAKPKLSIVNFAEEEEHKIDLIVIGATGTDMFDRLLVGSTTNYVVNHAPCNVIVVKK
ncbi:universal stress protein [Lactococcus ileimucosae]|uniref:universal stress protein n=1 Tax=Lactococcus ileimucosae TaxID=2941329 RepID=UPI00204429CB|nr:universal stress protein [Lactococcus ileimucosae]